MALWTPDTGETILARDAVAFATGTAQRVAGMRWFRNPEREDIQDELPGWPEGPTFSPRKEQKRPVRAAGLFGLQALYVLVIGVLETLAGTGSALPGPGPGPGRAQEPENEVDDFPVIWAAPDTIARSLPWQLDPARRSEDYRTHVIVTDRRLVVVGLPEGDPRRDEVLWAIERSKITRVERMRFSDVGGEARIHFTDGSWCRLAPPSTREHWSVLRHLAHPTELFPLDALTPRQRKYVDSYLESLPKRAHSVDPVITRRPSGKLLVEVAMEERVRTELGFLTHSFFMTESGRQGAITPKDL
jgi:hypothetical protein